MALSGTDAILVKTTGGTIVKTNTIDDVRTFVESDIHDLPPGGSTGQILTKTSASDYAVSWSTPQDPAQKGAVNGFRLSAVSGDSVSTTDTTASTLYWTPHIHDAISLYNGTGWDVLTTTERTLSLGTLTSDKNYDVFVYNNAGTPTLELGAAWTNDTTRATAIVKQNGVWCKSGALTRRYVGTLRTVSTTTYTDSVLIRGLYNADNQVGRRLFNQNATAHTYTTATWRRWNNTDTGTLVQAVIGLPAITFEGGQGFGIGCASTFDSRIGISIDNISSNYTPGAYTEITLSNGSTPRATSIPIEPIPLPIGFTWIRMCELGGSTGGNFVSASITIYIMM